MSPVTRRVLVGALAFGAVLAGVRVSVGAPSRCSPPSAAELEGAAAEAVAWFARNLEPDGRWVYGYERASGELDPAYNIVRHAGVALSLAQAERAGFVDATAPLDAGLAYADDHLVVAGDGLAFGFAGRDFDIGASALLVTALAERRLGTGEDAADETLRGLGRFLVGQVEADGQVLARYDADQAAPVPGETSPFFTGETLWALARLHTLFSDEGWDEPTRRIANYVATERDDRERRIPPVSDHWAGYAYGEIAHWPTGSGLTDADRAYARRQAGFFAAQAGLEAQKVDGVRRLTHGPDALAAGVGTLGEGLGGIWRAGAVDDDLAAVRLDVADAAGCASSLLVARQISAADATGDHDPSVARGAWFSQGRTQMDDQQHALSAILAYMEIRSEQSADTRDSA